MSRGSSTIWFDPSVYDPKPGPIERGALGIFLVSQILNSLRLNKELRNVLKAEDIREVADLDLGSDVPLMRFLGAKITGKPLNILPLFPTGKAPKKPVPIVYDEDLGEFIRASQTLGGLGSPFTAGAKKDYSRWLRLAWMLVPGTRFATLETTDPKNPPIFMGSRANSLAAFAHEAGHTVPGKEPLPRWLAIASFPLQLGAMATAHFNPLGAAFLAFLAEKSLHPILHEEALASEEGTRNLEELGFNKEFVELARKRLRSAHKTYLINLRDAMRLVWLLYAAIAAERYLRWGRVSHPIYDILQNPV